MTVLQFTGILMVLVPMLWAACRICLMLGWHDFLEFVGYMVLMFCLAAWLTAGVLLAMGAWP